MQIGAGPIGTDVLCRMPRPSCWVIATASAVTSTLLFSLARQFFTSFSFVSTCTLPSRYTEPVAIDRLGSVAWP